MIILVKFIGMIIALAGVIFMFKPNIMQKCAVFWKDGKRLYAGAVLAIAISVIFLLAATQCRVTWIVAVVGIISLIKGIALFALGPGKIAAMLKWWTDKPLAVLRLIAILPLIIGILLIYAA